MIRVHAVEVEFDAPLVNPATGAESRTFRLAGKLDAVVELADGLYVLEHKTSGEDIRPGSEWWKRLRLETQASVYLVGARSLGYDVRGVVYDVLGKPGLRPLKATPVEERKYTQPTKKDPVSRLYKNQREHDESPEEYRERVRTNILENPDAYYQRSPVVRLQDEEREAAFDAWQTAALIREGRNAERWPRNPDSCVMYSQRCPYWGVCVGEESLDDPRRFRLVADPHEELSRRERRLPVLTSSEMKTYRACSRKHHYSYELGIRSVATSEALRLGTLVHKGLEAWWTAPNGERLVRAIGAVQAESDVWDRIKVEEMLTGYHARWVDELEGEEQAA